MLAGKQTHRSSLDFWVHAIAGAGAIVAVAAALVLAGCNSFETDNPMGSGGSPGGGSTMPPPAPPPPQPPPPSAPNYVRGSLSPRYQLTPRSEYGRIQQAGVIMSDADFTSINTITSSASKMDELAAQIARESGITTPIDLIPDASDRQ